MKCRFCPASFDDQHELSQLYSEREDGHATNLYRWRCPACLNWTITLQRQRYVAGVATVRQSDGVIYPDSASRSPAPPEVAQCDAGLAQDFLEACDVLSASPKASAALARRCLQHIIRSQYGIKKRNLDEEITDVETQKLLTPSLAAQLDAIRNLGNFAAHPIQNGNTGEIIDVDPAEAEWTLDVLEGLFDAVFVGPVKAWNQMATLNAKIVAAGKPPMDMPPLPQGYVAPPE
jgi:hypothetical protein